MIAGQREGRGFLDGPWPWLAYLPLYFAPWLWTPLTQPQLIWSVLGIAAFLMIYWVATRATGQRLIVALAAMLLISFPLAFVGGNWTVFPVYAAAFAGDLRPSSRGAWTISGIAILVAMFAAGIGQFWPWGLFGTFMVIMVGFGNLSRAALEDKNAALAAAQDEVRRLAATTERERIGRDLHDLLGRTLTLAALKAELAAKLAGRDPARAVNEMHEVAQAAREALREVRAAVTDMAGTSLGREVEAAVRALAAAGIDCEVIGAPGSLPDRSGAVLAMTLREAVTNVIRHSRARLCRIEIAYDGSGVRLAVTDDGADAALKESGGLLGMRKRLTAAGGNLDLSSGAAGTALVATMPVRRSPPEHAS